MGENPRIAIVATVKAPLGVLRPWIDYHRRVGIGRFILFFDEPEDAALVALGSEEDVTAVRCNDRYWSRVAGGRPDDVPPRQLVNLERGMAMAREAGIDWFAHIDADELIRPLAPLPGLLARCDADALKMDMREAVPERLDYASIFEAQLFKKVPTRGQALAAVLRGCLGAFRYGEYFRGHTESKMLVRVGGGVTRMGVHRPREWRGEPRLDFCPEIQLLHFDGIGFDDWDAKWAIRPGHTFGMRPARRRQLAAYERAAAKGRPARVALYRKSQMIAPRERRALERMGLLERIAPAGLQSAEGESARA